MFMRRLIVDGASFVRSVDKTKWPVNALTAISAVSKVDLTDQDDVRIQPRRRSAIRSSVDLLLHLDLIDAVELNSTDPRPS